ncbi:hypothetical protein GCK72_008779 [Caenorhabditis remanei]|uniref:Uncharacterized protein n=1 Tax=Caenorhabditis remanei TaxID=31234 RepID=A0A6A5GYF9_CAERE|nr:hypothetical protein GCK72_008779 [Caenorhabditis remanei]KAF1760530.1 hypothetical protein GCK72_008779 [Caenorhabditis remanei]
MPPPNLLEVPELPLQMIIDYLTPAATVNFALSNEKIREFIGTINLNLETISLKITEKRCSITLVFFYSERSLVWKFVSTPSNDRPKPNLKIKVCENPLDFCIKAVNWLTKLTRFPVTSVTIEGPDFQGTRELLEWEAIRECERLTMSLIDEMTGNLDDFKDLEYIDLVGCDWMTPEILETCRAKTISLFSVNWALEQIIQVIRNWLESTENRKLEYLSVAFKDSRDDALTILDAFNTKPWDRMMRHPTFPRRNTGVPLDLSGARDIERSDGFLASILVDSDGVDFVVWHDRFPVQEEL